MMIYRTFIIAVFLVFTYGCSDSNNDDGFGLSPVDPVVPPAGPIELTNSSEPEWLYVQTAATAQMTSNTTLKIPFTRDVFGFTDRPYREHAYFTAFEFASFWSEEGANSFSADPPNAVLTWLVGEEQREAEVIIKNATVYSDGVQESLVYEVTLETEQMPDAQMSYVSLFVDSNDASATSGVDICPNNGRQNCTLLTSRSQFLATLEADVNQVGTLHFGKINRLSFPFSIAISEYCYLFAELRSFVCVISTGPVSAQ